MCQNCCVSGEMYSVHGRLLLQTLAARTLLSFRSHTNAHTVRSVTVTNIGCSYVVVIPISQERSHCQVGYCYKHWLLVRCCHSDLTRTLTLSGRLLLQTLAARTLLSFRSHRNAHTVRSVTVTNIGCSYVVVIPISHERSHCQVGYCYKHWLLVRCCHSDLTRTLTLSGRLLLQTLAARTLLSFRSHRNAHTVRSVTVTNVGCSCVADEWWTTHPA